MFETMRNRAPSPRRLLSSAMPAFALGAGFGLLVAFLVHRSGASLHLPASLLSVQAQDGELVARLDGAAALSRTSPHANRAGQLSPAQLALGPRSEAALSFYAPLIRSLSALGPPAPECFRPDAPPRRFDTVLVVAQGRSGSTSLVRLLNSAFKCYNVRGENSGIFSALGSFAAARAKTGAQGPANGWDREPWSQASLKRKPAWFNRYDDGRSDGLLRLLAGEMIQHVPGLVTSGFKSITLFLEGNGGIRWNASLAFIDHWIDLFPRTAIILLSRPGVEKSGWWRSTRSSDRLLAKQHAWMREFHGLVQGGRYRDPAHPDRRVESAELDYADLVSCHPGSSIQRMYDVLDEPWNEGACRQIMAHNVEDNGLADSGSQFSPEQGSRGFTYGYRLLDAPSETPSDPAHYGAAIGGFVPFTDFTNGSIGMEHRAQPFPGNKTRVAVAKGFSVPTADVVEGGKIVLAAACTRFVSRSALQADAVARVPGLLSPCKSAHKGFAVLLLVRDKVSAGAFVELGGNGTYVRAPFDAAAGEEPEMCVLPTFDGRREAGWHRMCVPLLSQLVIMRRGGEAAAFQ
ncbi:hypothetical protein DFJ74DRAFT_676279 [Hyaloraphidium curvatum]|nr:hypothetical protein DFJ74DRAFT_676279 [Hyaloraphidium curvatum]